MSVPIDAPEWFWPVIAALIGLTLMTCLRMLAGYVEHQGARVNVERKIIEMRRQVEARERADESR